MWVCLPDVCLLDAIIALDVITAAALTFSQHRNCSCYGIVEQSVFSLFFVSVHCLKATGHSVMQGEWNWNPWPGQPCNHNGFFLVLTKTFPWLCWYARHCFFFFIIVHVCATGDKIFNSVYRLQSVEHSCLHMRPAQQIKRRSRRGELSHNHKSLCVFNQYTQ